MLNNSLVTGVHSEGNNENEILEQYINTQTDKIFDAEEMNMNPRSQTGRDILRSLLIAEKFDSRVWDNTSAVGTISFK